jgi:hypothetical protein
MLNSVEKYVFMLAALVGITLGVAAGTAVFHVTQEAYEIAADAYLKTLETRIDVETLKARLNECESGYGI